MEIDLAFSMELVIFKGSFIDSMFIIDNSLAIKHIISEFTLLVAPVFLLKNTISMKSTVDPFSLVALNIKRANYVSVVESYSSFAMEILFVVK